MSKAVIVIPVDFDHLEAAAIEVQRAFREYFDDKGVQLHGPIQVAIRDDYQLVMDVFEKPEIGGGRHVALIDVEEDVVHVEHSLRCRRAGLEKCPILGLVRVAYDSGALDDDMRMDAAGVVGQEHARLEVRLREDGVLLWGDEL